MQITDYKRATKSFQTGYTARHWHVTIFISHRLSNRRVPHSYPPTKVNMRVNRDLAKLKLLSSSKSGNVDGVSENLIQKVLEAMFHPREIIGGSRGKDLP